MQPRVHWINLNDPRAPGRRDLPAGARLGIMARPRTGDWLEDEITGWWQEGIATVVSLLERDEVVELDLGGEGDLCLRASITFVSFPIPDRGVSRSVSDTLTMITLLASELRQGRAVAIHCRAGIGRSAVVAACVMVCLGTGADVAFALIGEARGVRVPDTEAQRLWVEDLAVGVGKR